MNHYTYSEIQIGMNESFNEIITEEMQNLFCKMSGDINPMHMSDDYAVSRGIEGVQGRLVYGLLVGSLYSRLVGVYLPGEYCIFQECNIKWQKPVNINDELYVYGKVVDKDDRFKTITIRATIRNQHGKRVSSAELVVGINDGKEV
ncbi:MAG: dehydratase [Clostridium sp.]|nr:dehydratase [Clostridium sp.]